MQKRVKIDRSRLDRFKFEPLTDLKIFLKEKPEINDELRVDFNNTLIKQGIKIDENFKQQIRTEWRATIKSDIKRVAEEAPDSKNWYLKRVLSEKPIKLRVKINRETGEKKKTLRGSS